MEPKTLASWQTSLRDGYGVLHYPRELSDEDDADLIEWLKFIGETLQQRRTRRLEQPPSADAVDPSAADPGTPTTRDKEHGSDRHGEGRE